MIPRRYLAFALCLLLAGAWGHGWRAGGMAADRRAEARRIEFQAQLEEIRAEVAEKEAELLARREAQRMLAMEIEDEARADPLAPSRVPQPDSLRRLARRWGEGAAAP